MSELLTIAQVAQILGVSEDTVIRRFEKVKGVVDLGSPETPRRRRYRVLRIPRTVVERFVIERGGRITVPDVPQKTPEKKREAARTEDDIARDLATVANQHGTAARKTLDKIARRAKAMTFVPESEWADLVWFDEDED